MFQELSPHNIQHRDSIPHYCNSQNNKLWCKKSAARKSLAIQRKMSSNKYLYSKRKDRVLDSYQLAVIKQVVLKCRANIKIRCKNGILKPLSFAKIGGAFMLSSRTVWKWTNRVTAFSRVRIFVNVKQIAYALQAWMSAYRNGWVEEIDISKVLQGDADP